MKKRNVFAALGLLLTLALILVACQNSGDSGSIKQAPQVRDLKLESGKGGNVMDGNRTGADDPLLRLTWKAADAGDYQVAYILWIRGKTGAAGGDDAGKLIDKRAFLIVDDNNDATNETIYRLVSTKFTDGTAGSINAPVIHLDSTYTKGSSPTGTPGAGPFITFDPPENKFQLSLDANVGSSQLVSNNTLYGKTGIAGTGPAPNYVVWPDRENTFDDEWYARINMQALMDQLNRFGDDVNTSLLGYTTRIFTGGTFQFELGVQTVIDYENCDNPRAYIDPSDIVWAPQTFRQLVNAQGIVGSDTVYANMLDVDGEAVAMQVK